MKPFFIHESRIRKEQKSKLVQLVLEGKMKHYNKFGCFVINETTSEEIKEIFPHLKTKQSISTCDVCRLNSSDRCIAYKLQNTMREEKRNALHIKRDSEQKV